MKSADERLCPGPLAFGYETLPQKDEEEHEKEMNSTQDIQQPTNIFLDIYAYQNFAITLSYFNSGFATKFIETPVTYYLIAQLNASSSQMAAFKGLSDLPWTMKVLFGILSDGFPVNNYRRKPWFFMGWILFIFVNLLLVESGHPSIQKTIFLSVLAICFNALSEVSQDTLCLERAGLEPDSSRGMLQTTVYTIKAFGAVLGAMIGAVVYNKDQWGWGLDISDIFLIQALMPLLTVAFIWHLVELSSGYPVPSLQTQLLVMWNALKLKAGKSGCYFEIKC
jgi:hypothetical protein